MSESQDTNRSVRPKRKAPSTAWKKGQSGNPGGRPLRARADYEAVSFATVSLEKWKLIVAKAVADALNGEDKARAFIAKILGAEASQKIEAKISGDPSAPLQIAYTNDWKPVVVFDEAPETKP